MSKEKALLEQQIEREHEEQARLARRQQDAHVSRGVESNILVAALSTEREHHESLPAGK